MAHTILVASSAVDERTSSSVLRRVVLISEVGVRRCEKVAGGDKEARGMVRRCLVSQRDEWRPPRKPEKRKRRNVLLDLPDSSLISHGELEILLGDRVPVLSNEEPEARSGSAGIQDYATVASKRKRGESEQRAKTHLVDHHHTQQHAEHKEEQSVDVVLHGVAHLDREGEEDDGSGGEEGRSEDDVSEDLRNRNKEAKVSAVSTVNSSDP